MQLYLLDRMAWLRATYLAEVTGRTAYEFSRLNEITATYQRYVTWNSSRVIHHLNVSISQRSIFKSNQDLKV